MRFKTITDENFKIINILIDYIIYCVFYGSSVVNRHLKDSR